MWNLADDFWTAFSFVFDHLVFPRYVFRNENKRDFYALPRHDRYLRFGCCHSAIEKISIVSSPDSWFCMISFISTFLRLDLMNEYSTTIHWSQQEFSKRIRHILHCFLIFYYFHSITQFSSDTVTKLSSFYICMKNFKYFYSSIGESNNVSLFPKLCGSVLY